MSSDRSHPISLSACPHATVQPLSWLPSPFGPRVVPRALRLRSCSWCQSSCSWMRSIPCLIFGRATSLCLVAWFWPSLCPLETDFVSTSCAGRCSDPRAVGAGPHGGPIKVRPMFCRVGSICAFARAIPTRAIGICLLRRNGLDRTGPTRASGRMNDL